MTKPRQVLPGTVYLVTRRCSERRFFLLSSPPVQNFFLYCLACAADRCNIRVHAVCCMSNHFHLVCTDPDARIPEFMQWLNCMLARGLNCFHGRRGHFWDPGPYNAVALIQPDDVIDKMLYTLANPVAAGLVSSSEDWPGVHSGSLQGGSRKLTATKPRFFFDSTNRRLPEFVELVVESPKAFDCLPEGTSFDQLLKEKEARIRESFQQEGRAFLGRERVLRRKPTDSPSTEEPPGKIHPRIACKDKELREKVLEALAAWVRAYRQALKEFARGVRDVVFPAGTFKMRVQLGVRCEAPPPEPELEPG